MKFLARLFCALVIVGTCAFMAHAQTSTDPTVGVHYDPPTPCTTFSGDSLSEPFGFTGCIEYTGASPNPLTTFFFDLTSVPADTSFGCQTNIWSNCNITDEGSGVWQFEFSGTGTCNYNDGTGGNGCLGLATDQAANVTETPDINETPEPASLLLFGTGFFAIAIVAKRRLGAETKLV